MLAAGAVISIFSVTLVIIYGQTRILFAMGRDGMIPPLFHRVNPRTLTPVPTRSSSRSSSSLLAGLVPINFLAEMTSIGTLVAFLVVSIGVIILRRTMPDLPRGFKVPGYPVTPILSIAGCIWIIQDLRAVTIYVFFGLGRRSRSSGTSSTASATPARRRHAAAERGDAMTLVVGFAPDERGRAALHLACMLARSGGDDLVVCAVVPRRGRRAWRKVDAEYRAYLDGTARRGAEAGPRAAARGHPRRAVVQHARSAPAGLLEVAEQHDAASSSRFLLGRRVRPHRARQRHRPAPAQLARAGRAGAARLPRAPGRAGDARDGGVRRVRGRGRPRRRGGRGRRAGRCVAADRLVRRPLAAALHVRRRQRARARRARAVGQEIEAAGAQGARRGRRAAAVPR